MICERESRDAPWLVMNAAVIADVVFGRTRGGAAEAGEGDWRECRDSAGVQACGGNPAGRGRRRRVGQGSCRCRWGGICGAEPRSCDSLLPICGSRFCHAILIMTTTTTTSTQLPVPGVVVVYEAGSSIEARTIPAGEEAAYNPDQLLDAESLPGSLGCGTGVRETDSGRPIRSPPRRSRNCCRSVMWPSRSAGCGRWS